jgi:hypothetical protein
MGAELARHATSLGPSWGSMFYSMLELARPVKATGRTRTEPPARVVRRARWLRSFPTKPRLDWPARARQWDG